MDYQEKLKSESKQSRIDEAIRRKRMKRAGIILIIIGLVVALGYLLVWYSTIREENLPGVLIPDQGREHVATTTHPVYNSNPPTSGWHFSAPAEWGAYKKELQDEVLIHNLEHGGIWISYRPDIPDDLKKELEGFYDRWGRKVIVTPRSKNDTDIAVAAWNYLDAFSSEEYSRDRVEKFIKAFRNKGPEYVP